MEEWFRSDLMALERDGKPLWDGKSEIYLREALAEEADQWRVAYRGLNLRASTVNLGWMHAGCYILSRRLIRLIKEGRSSRK